MMLTMWLLLVSTTDGAAISLVSSKKEQGPPLVMVDCHHRLANGAKEHTVYVLILINICIYVIYVLFATYMYSRVLKKTGRDAYYFSDFSHPLHLIKIPAY